MVQHREVHVRGASAEYRARRDALLAEVGRRRQAGQTIGTVQPGVIWAGQYFQIGAEAILPATRLTGHGYGGVVQFHVYLDDLFPHSIGRPISEWW